MTLLAAETAAEPGLAVLALTEAQWVAVQAIATAATGMILLATLIVAGVSLLQVRGQREDQIRPYVVVDIEPSTMRPIVDFVVRNIGRTAARDVRITTEPPLETTTDAQHPNYALKNSVMMTEGIPMLAPGREIRAYFESMPDRVEADLTMRYEGAVTYGASRGRATYSETFTIDLRVHLGLMYTEEKTVHHVAKELQKLARRMDQWTEGLSGLKVYTQDWPSYAWQTGRLRRHPSLVVRRVQAWVDVLRVRFGRKPVVWNPQRRRMNEVIKRRDEREGAA